MRKVGFRRGKYNPCLYYHVERNLKTFLHGDDFATVGTRARTSWFKEALEKRFEIKSSAWGQLPSELVARLGLVPLMDRPRPALVPLMVRRPQPPTERR